MIPPNKLKSDRPGTPVYKVALASLLAFSTLIYLQSNIDALEKQYAFILIICLLLSILVLLLFVVKPRYKKDPLLIVSFLIVLGLNFLVGYNRRKDFKKEQLTNYGQTATAWVTKVTKERSRRGPTKWKSTFFYFISGKKLVNSISRRSNNIAEKDTLLIKYSTRDPGLFELLEVFKYQPKPPRYISNEYLPVGPAGINLNSTIFETPPQFKGGKEGLNYYIAANLTYPLRALKNKTSGIVFVSFVIDTDGSIVNIKVEKGIGDGCDEAAVNAVKLLPKWSPALKNGKPVKVKYNLPINFRVT